MLAQLVAELAADPEQPGLAKTLQVNQPAVVSSGNHQGPDDFLA
jgi:hypothetical protein